MEVLKVVQQLRDLAADPQNRATIVRVCISYIKKPCSKVFNSVCVLYYTQYKWLYYDCAIKMLTLCRSYVISRSYCEL